METVIVPARTIVRIGDTQVRFATDTIVEVEYENMKYLTGYHYTHLPESSDSAPEEN